LIGSTLFKYLSTKKNLNVTGTYNSNKPPFKNLKKYDFQKDDITFIKNFDLVINCIGITKHNDNSSNLKLVYDLNIKLPLLLNDLASSKEVYVIHISTDCIFSGSKGNYRENSKDFSRDIYGESKRIAESLMRNSLVIRCSTIGHEFFFQNGLLEWFLSTEKKCKGFKNAYFNGLTTLELGKIIFKYFISKSFFPKTLLNIGSEKISKYDLLCEVKKIYNLKVEIEQDYKFKIDRSLNIAKFTKLTAYKPKTWYKMLLENKYYISNV
jgi:dTDP-4-dehydrorhamnose reductase